MRPEEHWVLLSEVKPLDEVVKKPEDDDIEERFGPKRCRNGG